MNITAIRELLDRIKEKFDDDASIELFTDGSGAIISNDSNVFLADVEFDGLGELAEILYD